MGMDKLGLVIGLRNGILLGIAGLIIGGTAAAMALTGSVTGTNIGAATFALGLLEGLIA